MQDEEEARPEAAAGLGRDLRTLSIADLNGYITSLEHEIARVRTEIARRQDVRGAAEALFRRPAGADDEPR